jgi:glycosyltransferase involved in cell wall biosynthesis
MVRSIESDGGVVDLLRVELCSDIRELRFAENWKVGYVCGEFSNDCVNPASIYRRSQRLAKKFYWRPLYGGTIVAGTMDRGPAISVIIPVYNVEKYIDDCVSSVLDQSFDDYEVILVDDGSTDRSGEHCDHLSRVDKRVRVISKSNGGCASARMAGLDAAVGDYVMFVDSDDCLAPQALRRLYEAAIAQNAEIAQGTWSRVFQDGQTTSGNLKERGFIFQIGQSGFGINKDFAILETPTIWRRIYKRVFLKDNGIEFPIQFRRFDDLPFQFHSIALASRIAHTPHDVYNYKVGRDGQDVSINDERLFIHFPLLAYVRSLARRIGTNDAFKTFIRIQLATHTWGLQKIVPELRKKYTLFIARDLFGPEQGHNSFRLLRRLLRVGHGRRVEILKLYLLFLLRARKVRLPQ